MTGWLVAVLVAMSAGAAAGWAVHRGPGVLPAGVRWLRTRIDGRGLPRPTRPAWASWIERWPWPARPPADVDLVLLVRRAGWHRIVGDDGLGWICRALGVAAWTGGASGACLAVVVAATTGFRHAGWWLLPGVGFLAGRRVFLACLEAAGRRRAARVRAGLPGWLEDVALAARGGLNLRQAVEVANEVGHGPLVDDAREAFARVRAGEPLRRPLQELARLYPDPAVTVALRTLVEAEARGLPLAPTLDDQIRLMRALAARRLQRQADGLPFWLTVVTMGLLLPPVLIVVLLPNVLQFLRLYR